MSKESELEISLVTPFNMTMINLRVGIDTNDVEFVRILLQRYDEENGAFSDNPVNIAFDNGSYPYERALLLGVSGASIRQILMDHGEDIVSPIPNEVTYADNY